MVKEAISLCAEDAVDGDGVIAGDEWAGRPLREQLWRQV